MFAVEIAAEVALLVVRGPSSVVFVVHDACVVIVAEALPRVIESDSEQTLVSLARCIKFSLPIASHSGSALGLSSEARDVESPQVDERLVEA